MGKRQDKYLNFCLRFVEGVAFSLPLGPMLPKKNYGWMKFNPQSKFCEAHWEGNSGQIS